MIHHPTHWIAVGLAALLAVLAFEAAGQTMSMGSGAMFEGRPSMAGAQAGLGAQAGPPQGGIGVQGTEATGMNLVKPRIVREAREGEVVVSIVDEERILPKRVEPDTTPMEARALARESK
jgi:hypothetical protein